MVDTVRSADELINSLFAEGQVPRSITEQDVRDLVVSVSLETADLSSLPRAPDGLAVGRLWIDFTNALRIVTEFQPSNTISFARVGGLGSLFAQGLSAPPLGAFSSAFSNAFPVILGGQEWLASATIGGLGAVSADANVVSNPLVHASISGTGAIYATPVRLLAGGATLGGAGLARGPAIQRMRATRTIGGVGALTADGVLGATMTWGSTSPDNTKSGGNLISTKSGSDNLFTATIGSKFKSSGKWYFEIDIVTESTDAYLGLANPSASLNAGGGDIGSYLGLTENSIGWADTDGTLGHDLYTGITTYDHLPGHVWGGFRGRFALDCDNWKWWVSMNGGAWNGTTPGTQDPATNQGGMPVPTDLRTGGVTAAVSMFHVGDVATGCFASGSWNYVAPSGFSAI